MKKNIKISVIVPVHNSQQYLKRCLDSILNQTLKDIEIIIVENGSIDKSREIMNLYSSKENIKMYYLNFPSIGSARNKGIDESNGEYLLFFDSDDYMEKNMCEELYKKAKSENLDLVTSDYYEYKKGNTQTFLTQNFESCNIYDNMELLWKINYGPIKLFRKEIIDKCKLKFPTNLKYEDIPFVFNYILKSQKIGKVNKPLFTYVMHENTQTTIVDKRVFDILAILKSLNEQKIDKCYNEAILNFNVRTITNYTIQQRYQNNMKLRNNFIENSFSYLNDKFPKWRECKYLNERSKFKTTIEKNENLTKIYCTFYNFIQSIFIAIGK